MRTWLADQHGQLALVMWPGNFSARFDPLEIIDNHDQTVAHGGSRLLLAGGDLKRSDARSLVHRKVFCAWQVSEAEDCTETPRRPPARRRPFRGERLATTERDVADLSSAVAHACAALPWVREAYICRVRPEFTDDGSHHTLLATFVVTDSPAQERPTASRELLALLPSPLRTAAFTFRPTTSRRLSRSASGCMRSELDPAA